MTRIQDLPWTVVSLRLDATDRLRQSAAMKSTHRVLAYRRVSTDEQADSGLGLAHQEAVIRAWCQRHERELIDVVTDAGVSAKSLDRPGMTEALRRLADGEADVLVVAKLDRLTRSVGDLTALLDWTMRAGVGLVALDLDIDTTTPGGRMVVQVFATVAEWERGIISERTRNALSTLRAQGRPVSRPALDQSQPELAARIRRMRTTGMTMQAIADTLNMEGVPTVRGGARWRHSSVQSALGYSRPRPIKASPDLPEIRRKRPQRSPSGL